MRIAFYAPLKSPDHVTPSGDRQMARMLIRALRDAGNDVNVASHLRTYIPNQLPEPWTAIRIRAEQEVARIAAEWSRANRPDVWFCYHPYYKAPDLLGPMLAHAHGIAYVTAEASYSSRRNLGIWSCTQSQVVDAVALAALNLCFTKRDRDGLVTAVPHARLEMLAPFIDTGPFEGIQAQDNVARLIAVAMMRRGDKHDSFAMLAKALNLLTDLPWTLSVAGGGEMLDAVQTLFGDLPAHRLDWLGAVPNEQIPHVFQAGGVFAWPGCGEAYGLAYLEAQAAGVPVVAQAVAGVSEVVVDTITGLLTPAGDIAAYAAAIRRLLEQKDERLRMAAAARQFVFEQRSLSVASRTLKVALEKAVGRQP